MTIVSGIALPAHHPFSGRDMATVLAERIAAFGDRIFLVWEPPLGCGNRSTWTYAEFGAAVDRTSSGLHARGVVRGDAVMLLLENSPAFLVTWFACARLGAVAVDTNVRYASEEIEYAASVTTPVGVVTDVHLVDRLAGLPGDAWVVTVDAQTGTCATLDADPSDLPPREWPDAAAPLCIQFTSGTTSRPKAALYTHANAMWAGQVSASHSRMGADDIILVHAPLFHTAALFWQTMAAFWVGASVVLMAKYSRSRFWEVSVRNGCTQTFFHSLMVDLRKDEVPDHRYTTWISGAEIPILERIFRMRILSCWGMTEVVTSVLINDPAGPSVAGSIGRVSPEYTIRIVKPDDDATDNTDEGELRVGGVRGLSLFAGYHGNHVATEAGFDGDGYWCTGDLVRVLPSGDIQFVSRIKDMLRVGGENVAAAEIERVLTQHPLVSGAGVIGHPDRMRGELPVAFVVAPGAGDGIEAELIEHCRERLAAFKVPVRVHLIDEMPESLIGKISKKVLLERSIELGIGDA